MMPRQIQRFLGVALLLAIVSFDGIAQESRPVTTAELVKRSNKIVTAQVVSLYSDWDEHGREIYTYVTLKVEQIVKSEQKDKLIEVRQLGGKVGEIESHVAGLPRFEEGERVLVFLGPYPKTKYYGLIDWAVGKYVIQTDKKGQEVLVGGAPGHGQTVDSFITTLRGHL